MRAAIYCRLSSDPRGDRAGVERQEVDARALVDLKRWELAGVYIDNDKSATSGKARPEFERMLTDMAEGRIDAIVTWHLDRLVRLMSDLVRVIDLGQPRRLHVATVHGVSLDMGDPTGIAVAQILTAIAGMEVAHKAERQRAANGQRAERGQASTGGHRTLGYTRGMAALVPSEAEPLAAGFAAFVEGDSLRAIARRWNESGFTTTHGGEWTSYGVRCVLRNPRYAGRSVHRGEVVGPGQWQPLVDPDTFDAAQAILDDPTRRTTPTTARRYLLSGMAKCGKCGAAVSTGRSGRGQRTYGCADSRHLVRGAEPIDKFVTDLALQRLSAPDAADLTMPPGPERPGMAELRTERAAITVRAAELADMLADGQMTREQFARANERVMGRLREIAGEMADRSRLEVLAPFLADTGDAEQRRARAQQAWGSCDIDRQRAVLAVLFDRIELLAPGRGARYFDPATVSIGWAGQPVDAVENPRQQAI